MCVYSPPSATRVVALPCGTTCTGVTKGRGRLALFVRHSGYGLVQEHPALFVHRLDRRRCHGKDTRAGGRPLAAAAFRAPPHTMLTRFAAYCIELARFASRKPPTHHDSLHDPATAQHDATFHDAPKLFLFGAVLLALGTLGFAALEYDDPIDALYLSGMILTTIGYGEIAPTTLPGRVFFVFFSLVGLGYFGVIIERCGIVVEDMAGGAAATATGPSPKSPSSTRLAKWTAWSRTLLIGLETVALGTALFRFVEPDTFRTVPETVYFCVVTSTTIGFGDYYPKTRVGKVCVTVYAFFSLQIFAEITAHVGGEIKAWVLARPHSKGRWDRIRRNAYKEHYI